MSGAVCTGVRVIGLTNGLGTVRGRGCCAAGVGPGVWVVGSSPMCTAVRSIGGAAITIGSGIGIVGVIPVSGRVRIVISVIDVRRIVVPSTAGYDGSHRCAGNEH